MTPDYNNHYWAPSLTIWSEEKKTEILFLPVHQVYLDYLLHRKGKATGKWCRWESFAGSSTHKAPRSFSGPLWCCCSQAWPQHLGRLWQPPVRQDTSSLNLIKKLTPPFVFELCLISLWEWKNKSHFSLFHFPFSLFPFRQKFTTLQTSPSKDQRMSNIWQLPSIKPTPANKGDHHDCHLL